MCPISILVCRLWPVYTQALEALELKIRLRYPDSERMTQSSIVGTSCARRLRRSRCSRLWRDGRGEGRLRMSARLRSLALLSRLDTTFIQTTRAYFAHLQAAGSARAATSAPWRITSAPFR